MAFLLTGSGPALAGYVWEGRTPPPTRWRFWPLSDGGDRDTWQRGRMAVAFSFW